MPKTKLHEKYLPFRKTNNVELFASTSQCRTIPPRENFGIGWSRPLTPRDCCVGSYILKKWDRLGELQAAIYSSSRITWLGFLLLSDSFNTLLVTNTGSTAAAGGANVSEGAVLFGHPTLIEPPQIHDYKQLSKNNLSYAGIFLRS